MPSSRSRSTTRADIALDATIPVFHVTKASRLRGKVKKGEIGPTKNEGSVKENIPLHPDAAKALKRWKASGWAKRVGWQPRPTDPVFPDRKGKTWRPRSSDRIRADLEKAGQPKDVNGKPLDFHSTRRFFAAASDIEPSAVLELEQAEEVERSGAVSTFDEEPATE